MAPPPQPMEHPWNTFEKVDWEIVVFGGLLISIRFRGCWCVFAMGRKIEKILSSWGKWKVETLAEAMIIYSCCSLNPTQNLCTEIANMHFLRMELSILCIKHIFGVLMGELSIHWKDWCWSSNILAIWCDESTHWKIP